MSLPELSPRGRSETLFVAVALAVYVLVTAVTAWHHEPWRDEADSWLMARDASLPELLRLSGSVGSPSLWHLLLFPIAKSGLPYGAMHVLHLAIAWAAAAIWLRCSPFSRLTRGLVVFSYYLLCEYAVVARQYALAMLFLFAIAALWRRRFDRPFVFAALVGLLANAHTLAIPLAAALGAVFLWDLRGLPDGAARRRAWIAAGLMLAGGLLAVVQLVPPAGAQRPGLFFVRYRYAPAMVLSLLFITPSALAARIGDLSWLALLTLLALLAGWLARPRLLFLVLMGAGGMLYVFVFKWISGPRHVGLVFLVLLFALWLERLEPGAPPRWARAASRAGFALFHAGLLVSVVSAAEFVRLEVRHPYSYAEEMGTFLRDSGLAARPLATTLLCEGVLPYLPPRPVYYADARRWGTYRIWNLAEDRGYSRSVDQVAAKARQELPRSGGWLLLLDKPLLAPERYAMRPLHVTRGPIGPSDERFYLYGALPAPL